MKKSLAILSLTTILVTLILSGCYYDKAELVYPQAASCDTTNVKYSTDIVAILSANCYACHSGTASASGGRKFDDYTLLKNNFVNSGKLVLAVTHSPGATPMPFNQPKMAKCNIDKIIAWVNRGAPNN
ncbi:MAG: hypothetical protein K0Q66_1594 [Chitinophagaceae bacterium]|jgi:hypothetical protein|nr:hypothetical protein [Chitinophagaceae bacterium]